MPLRNVPSRLLWKMSPQCDRPRDARDWRALMVGPRLLSHHRSLAFPHPSAFNLHESAACTRERLVPRKSMRETRTDRMQSRNDAPLAAAVCTTSSVSQLKVLSHMRSSHYYSLINSRGGFAHLVSHSQNSSWWKLNNVFLSSSTSILLASAHWWDRLVPHPSDPPELLARRRPARLSFST